ncbi:MAG TPA: wax ester/triacylglycerol synthase family O-acyltransferase [Mycobacteriales bacterium]|jgi:WS/DGAT/MGAT family acyltransferase|nr:wax ester/triacylglycerol synthase family O-acyltransferase [Mycobacteriales bacterium]
MRLMSPTDSMFLIPESREQPMHVGSLQLFELPEGADRSLIRETYESMLEVTDVAPLFRKRPHRSIATLGQWAWVDDEDVDIEHHVRHSALPEPGRVRELLALTSRLHGTLLDRQRPLWEMHVIEGLEGDRFAVYTKLHHAVMDGVSGLRMLQRLLSESPDEAVPAAFWAPRERKSPSTSSGGGGGSLLSAPLAAAKGVTDLVRMTPTVLRLAEQSVREQATMLPLQAPRSMLNVPITGARRFAAQSWPIDTIRAVGRAAGASVNDVVLAMCSSALRAYMLELGALPDAPLVAMTPVSLRRDDDGSESSGNAVGTILCNLATDRDDAAERLDLIHASMQQGKELFSGLNQVQATAISAAMMTPLLLSMAPGGISRIAPPPFNVIISNVPGPKRPLYFNGARLQGVYPLSIPTTGQALNITVTSYAGSMEFGLIGCRRSVPHLQRLLTHLDDALEELVKVTGA